MLLRTMMAGVLLIALNVTLIGQQNRQEPRQDQSSATSVMLLLAAQLDCPLRFEQASFVQDQGGSRCSARGVLLPDQTVNPASEIQLSVPRTLLKTPGRDSPVKVIVVLIVGKVVFTDGSFYDGEQTYKTLQDYFQELDLGSKP